MPAVEIPLTPEHDRIRRAVARAMMENPAASSALGNEVLGVVASFEPARAIMALMAATQVAIEELAHRLAEGTGVMASDAQCAVATIVAENFTAFALKGRH